MIVKDLFWGFFGLNIYILCIIKLLPIIPLGQLSYSWKLISLIPLGGSLEVTPLAVKLLDNRLYMSSLCHFTVFPIRRILHSISIGSILNIKMLKMKNKSYKNQMKKGFRKAALRVDKNNQQSITPEKFGVTGTHTKQD